MPGKKVFLVQEKFSGIQLKLIAAATLLTAIVGLLLKHLIEGFILRDVPHAEIELIFGNLFLISASLAAVERVNYFSRMEKPSFAP